MMEEDDHVNASTTGPLERRLSSQRRRMAQASSSQTQAQPPLPTLRLASSTGDDDDDSTANPDRPPANAVSSSPADGDQRR